MVDPFSLTLDTLGNVASIALPAALWFLLFHLAWERPTFARSIGFGRTTFWLLLPASLVGILADLPVAGVARDILSVNIGGGVVPILLATWLLGRTFGDPWDSISLFWGFFAVESVALLLVVVAFPAGPVGAVLLLVVAVAVPASVLLLGSRALPENPALTRRLGIFLALVSGAILTTYVTTVSVPSQGILSAFPFYLLAPVGVGLFAFLLAPSQLGLPAGKALPLAYSAATFGVLVGADVLHQPPLYAAPAPALYAIGGAGLLDLLYLTGLIALAVAFLALRLSGYSFAPTESVELGTMGAPSPFSRVRRAFDLGVEGRSVVSVEQSALAARTAAEQARRLTHTPPTDPAAGPWSGLNVPAWVSADQANLDALASSGRAEPRDSFRAWLTARWLTRLGRDVSRSGFASPMTRLYAFGFDLVLVTAPAAVLWLYLAATIRGSFDNILSNPAFNAAAFGYAAWAFVYFVASESLFGTTPGKRVFGLAVRNRAYGRPGLLSVVVRDAMKLVPLTIIGIGGAVAAVVLLRGASMGAGLPAPLSTSSVMLLEFAGVVGSVVVGVALCAVVGLLLIASTAEHQRVGDLLGGTWVVREPRPGTIPFGATGKTEAVPPPPNPPELQRVG